MMARLRSLQQDWRFVAWLLATVMFLDVTAFVHLGRFLPLFLQEDLGVPISDIPRVAGLVAAASMLTGLPLAPFWGPLADRYSRKWMMLRSSFSEIVAYSLIALSGDVWMLVAARVIYGISHGSFPLAMAIQSLVTPRAKVGVAVAIIQAAFPLSASVGPPLGTLLIKTVGLRGLFVFDALLVTLGALLLLIFLREPAERDASASFGAQLRDLFTLSSQMPTIRWSFILHFFIASAAFGLDPFIAIAIQRANATSPWGWDDPTALGITLAVNGVVTAAATPLLGRLTDRVGAVRLMALSSLVALVCAFSLVFGQSLPAVWGLLLLLIIPQTVSTSASFAYLGTQTPPAQRSGVLGLIALPRNGAFLIAPSLAAFSTGLGFGAVFVVVGGFWTLALGAALHLQRLSPMARSSEPAAASATK